MTQTTAQTQSSTKSGWAPKPETRKTKGKPSSYDERASLSAFVLWDTYLKIRAFDVIESSDAPDILLLLQRLRGQLAGVLQRKNIPSESHTFLRELSDRVDNLTENIQSDGSGSTHTELHARLARFIVTLPPKQDFALHYLESLRACDIDEPIRELARHYSGARNYRRGMSWLALCCVLLSIGCGALGVWYALRNASESTAMIAQAENKLSSDLKLLTEADARLRDAITAVVGDEARHLLLRAKVVGLLVSTPASDARTKIEKALEDDKPTSELGLRNAGPVLERAANHENEVREDIDSALKVVAKQTVGWTYTAFAIVGLGAVALLAWLSATFMRLHREHQHGALRACEQLARLELAKAQFSVGDIEQSLALLETPPPPDGFTHDAA